MIGLMRWVRAHLGRPSSPPAEGTDPAVERSRHERLMAEQRLRLLETQVQAVIRDPHWRATPRPHPLPPRAEQGPSGEARP